MYSRKKPKVLPSAVRVRIRAAANTYSRRDKGTTSLATKGRDPAPKYYGQGAKAKERIRLNKAGAIAVRQRRSEEESERWCMLSGGGELREVTGLKARPAEDNGGVGASGGSGSGGDGGQGLGTNRTEGRRAGHMVRSQGVEYPGP
jgi:hypothetical protein